MKLEELMEIAHRHISALGGTDNGLLQRANQQGENITGHYSLLSQIARSGHRDPLGREPGMLLCDSVNRVLEQLRECALSSS